MSSGSVHSPMADALRAEIIRLCSEGDPKAGGAFTVDLALRIEKVVSAGRQILLAESVPISSVEALMARKRSKFDMDVAGDSDSDAIGSPFVVSSPMENFGMTAVRQIVAGMQSQSETPLKLVEALAAAREHHLDDVVKVLEKKLGVASEAQPSSALATLDTSGGTIQPIGTLATLDTSGEHTSTLTVIDMSKGIAQANGSER